jgi:hypothetical protein
MGKLNRNLITKIPIEKAITPFEGAYVMLDRYWVVEDGCILFWNKYSAQCNSQERIAQDIQKRIYPEGSVRFLPIVYVERDDRE